MENIFYSQGKLMEYAEAFKRLVGIYGDNTKTALALQLKETAAMLERICGGGTQEQLVTASEKSLLMEYLRSRGIITERILMIEPVPGHLELVMNIARGKRRAITAKELAEGIGELLHRSLRPAEGSRQVVTAESGEFIFEEVTKYRLLFGHASCNKGFARISGDNFSFLNIEGGRSVMSLADGMGWGQSANSFSTRFIELLEQLLEAGFSEAAAVVMLNNVFAANDQVGNPVTLDMCSINGYEGTADFFKMGAAASFIKRGSEVFIISSSALPAGVLEGSALDCKQETLQDGDYIIMMSDGVLDALPFYDKEKRMKEIIGELEERMPQALAERILKEVFFYDEKIADDMTVLVTGVWNRQQESGRCTKRSENI